MDDDLDRRQREIDRQQEALATEREHRNWAEQELAKYSPTEKRRLLAWLAAWVKNQPGHGADCNCGECD